MSNKYHQLTVREIIRETSDAITIVFDQTEERLQYEAGQFLTLILPIDGERVRRSYSLSTCPFLDKYPAVTVKRVASGKVSNYLNDQLKAGDTLEVMQPMGKFTTTLIGTEQRHLIMFGGGSGITPLMSIMKSVLYAEPKTKVSLIYANRDEESIIFKNQLDALSRKYDRTFKVIHILEEPSPDFPSLHGRIEPEQVRALLADLPQLPAVDTEYFICGPSGMMHNAIEGLKMLAVDHNRIHKESFVAGITSPSEGKEQEFIPSPENSEVSEESADKPVEDGLIGAFKTENETVKEVQEVTVVYDGEEYTFPVEPGNSILHTALALDIDLPYSCQSGICTACMGKCTSGRVKLDEEDTLTDGELQQGFVLTCVGHPLTPNVRIEID
ncbi:ring-1,2-phenylacetyl-CoA epoxidase subunit PaaE [Catalinimonas alkaloidigena]|uniref:ferredoxin--NADP reductase n=1 Tax=Catalinimonas alkaloidigena TaxID=1075417 RepID=UPI00240582CB|nr:ferredoxin--NADP reductase [Catalinimonas alkaloidigena]MDF9795168.1 ring-1,2-phenylacetyl-CoA epoxidase subunit PaaE [Catalinimonas alkaloidigena]